MIRRYVDALYDVGIGTMFIAGTGLNLAAVAILFFMEII